MLRDAHPCQLPEHVIDTSDEAGRGVRVLVDGRLHHETGRDLGLRDHERTYVRYGDPNDLVIVLPGFSDRGRSTDKGTIDVQIECRGTSDEWTVAAERTIALQAEVNPDFSWLRPIPFDDALVDEGGGEHYISVTCRSVCEPGREPRLDFRFYFKGQELTESAEDRTRRRASRRFWFPPHTPAGVQLIEIRYHDFSDRYAGSVTTPVILRFDAAGARTSQGVESPPAESSRDERPSSASPARPGVVPVILVVAVLAAVAALVVLVVRRASRRTGRRLLAVAAVLVVAAITMATLRAHRDEPVPQGNGPVSDAPRDVYAFLSASELGVVLGSTVVGRQAGKFFGAPHWTSDGRYAFAVDDPAETVVVIDGTGAVVSVPCGCHTAAPGPGGRIVWVADGKLMSLVPGTTVPQADPRALPPPPLAASAPTAVGTDGERVFLAQETIASASISSDALLAVHADGRVDTIEAETGTIVLVRPAEARGDGRVAYIVEYRSDPCRINREVHLLDGAGEVTIPDASAAGGGGADDTRSVSDLWWGRDGRLYATMSSGNCTDVASAASTGTVGDLISPPALWRLDGNTWSAVEATTSRAWRQLAADQRAVVGTDGRLYAERNGERTIVAENVRAIHAPSVGGGSDEAGAARGGPTPTFGPMVLTPTGVGPVRLGADFTDAERAGLVVASTGPDCTRWVGRASLEGLTGYPDRDGNEPFPG